MDGEVVPLQAGGIILWRERVVLRRTLNGEWVFPKGWIDPGETPEQTAIREIREETGLLGEVVRFLGIVPYPAEDETRPVAYYLVRVIDSPEWIDHAGLDAGCFPLPEVEGALSFENNRFLWSDALPEVERLSRRERAGARI